MIIENHKFIFDHPGEEENDRVGTLIEFGRGDIGIGFKGLTTDGFAKVTLETIAIHQIGSKINTPKNSPGALAVLAFKNAGSIDVLIGKLISAREALIAAENQPGASIPTEHP